MLLWVYNLMNDFRIIIYIFINLIDFIKKKNCVKVFINFVFFSYIIERLVNDNCFFDNVG